MLFVTCMSHTLIVTDGVEIHDFAKQTLTATLKCIAAAVMDRAPAADADAVIMEGAFTLIFV